eukprot:10744183-Ditylum_brightwellii.AAC.1
MEYLGLNNNKENYDEELSDSIDEEVEPDDIAVAFENVYWNATFLHDLGDVYDAAGAFKDVVQMETNTISSLGNNNAHQFTLAPLKQCKLA